MRAITFAEEDSGRNSTGGAPAIPPTALKMALAKRLKQPEREAAPKAEKPEAPPVVIEPELETPEFKAPELDPPVVHEPEVQTPVAERPVSPAVPTPAAAMASPEPAPADGASALPEKHARNLPEAPLTDLPILETFKLFLEAERKRARERMILVACLFGAAMVIVLIGAFIFLSQVKNRIADNMDAFEAMQKHLWHEQVDTAKALSNLVDRTQELHRGMMNSQHEFLASQLSRKDAPPAPAAAVAPPAASPAGPTPQEIADEEHTRQLELLRAQVRNQNKELLDQNARMLAQWSALSNMLAATVSGGAQAAERLWSERPALPSWRPSEVKARTRMQITVIPRGSDRAIAWRLPLP